MLKYWEHYNSHIRETVDWTIPSAEIQFLKKKEMATCMSIYKNKADKYHLNLSYYVGVDWIPETKQAIYVAPKLNTKTKEDGTPDDNVKFEDIQQTDYLGMLFSALKHPEIANETDDLFEIKWDKEYISIDSKLDLLTPLLVVQFLRIVHEIVRKGLKKSYYRVEQNLYSKVKGKILVGQTIKQNLLKNKPLNTYCTFDEFGVNGLENRLLKKALVFVRRYLPTLKIPHSEKYTTEVFNYIMPAFDFVSEEVNLNDIKHSKTNAFYKEYEEGIRLAKLILKRFGYNITNTQQTTILTPPFWIDMSKLFELYVLGMLKDRFGKNVIFQFSANYGNPDYLILSEKMVVDAKYKLKYQADNYEIENIRQISGYARDKKVIDKLKTDPSKTIDCLIIYPDQDIDIDNLINSDLRQNEIKQFSQFYKVAVKLPVLEPKS